MIVDELLLRDRHQPQYEHTVMTPQLRAEIRKMHQHAEERIFIVDNNISTPEQLYKDGEIPEFMFRKILNDYADVVDLSAFVTYESEVDKQAC